MFTCSILLFKPVFLLFTLVLLVSAAPTGNGCQGFHVTSPRAYFKTTAGQCYQVSYDFTGGAPSRPSTVSVDLYDSQTNKFVSSLVKNVKADSIATPWFNVNLGGSRKSGDYYFVVTYGSSCTPSKTASFYVDYNENSSPASCIA